MPCRGPRNRPFTASSSSRASCARARASVTVITACSCGSSAAIRSSESCSSSRAETCRVRISACSSAIERKARSVAVAGRATRPVPRAIPGPGAVRGVAAFAPVLAASGSKCTAGTTALSSGTLCSWSSNWPCARSCAASTSRCASVKRTPAISSAAATVADVISAPACRCAQSTPGSSVPPTPSPAQVARNRRRAVVASSPCSTSVPSSIVPSFVSGA